MSLEGDYDARNIFALIIAGDIPCARIFEDAHTLALLDIRPQAPGHSLVISKRSRARNILEIEPGALCEVMATVRRVAVAVRETLQPDGLQIAQFNGHDAGQTILHLHVHIIPRWKRDATDIGTMKLAAEGDATELAALAKRIAANIGD